MLEPRELTILVCGKRMVKHDDVGFIMANLTYDGVCIQGQNALVSRCWTKLTHEPSWRASVQFMWPQVFSINLWYPSYGSSQIL